MGDAVGEEDMRVAREIDSDTLSVTSETRSGPTGRPRLREMTRFFIFFKAASALDSRSKVM